MTLSEDFNWVQERSECSLSEMFQLLRQQVKRDVETRQAMCRPIAERDGRPVYAHSFYVMESGNSFTIKLEGNQINEHISFTLESKAIKVTDTHGETLFEAAPTINTEGKCVMKMGKQEYPLWYIRKMALEDLFFEIVMN